MVNGIPDVLQSKSSSPSSSSAVQVGTLHHFLIKRGALLPISVLNIVKGHHLQLSTLPRLFCNFHWFNIKVPLIFTASTLRPLRLIILLSSKKCRTFQPRGQLNHHLVLLVSIPMCLWSLSIQVVCILFSILSDLIAKDALSFRMPTIKQVRQLI